MTITISNIATTVSRYLDVYPAEKAGRALGMWLIPGGHIEPGDEYLLCTALRELAEETGVSWEDIAELPDADAIPVDIDVHPIPANPAKSEQDYWHADFRYVVKARRPDTITIQAEEVSSYNWLLPSLLHHQVSILLRAFRLPSWIAGRAQAARLPPRYHGGGVWQRCQ